MSSRTRVWPSVNDLKNSTVSEAESGPFSFARSRGDASICEFPCLRNHVSLRAECEDGEVHTTSDT